MVRLSFFLLCCLLAAAPAAAQTVADQPPRAAPEKAAAAVPNGSRPKAAAAQPHRPNAAATAKPHEKSGKTAPHTAGAKGLHARPWAFGPADSSRSAWQKGLPSQNLQQRAVGRENGGVNTATGINSALEKAGRKEKERGGMNVHVADESSSWRESTPAQNTAPDENLPMESRHVVRAYADMAPSEDLSIGVGPELILKNEQRERPGSASHQPESQLGLGMQFKLDF